MVKVFQYGSNLNKENFLKKLRRRGAPTIRKDQIVDRGRVDLPGYQVVFDVYSRTNRCAAADIVENPNSTVVGRIYEVPDGILNFLDRVEGVRSGNYRRKKVRTQLGEAVTYVVTDEARETFNDEHADALPSNTYLDHIVNGLNEVNGDLNYVSQLIETGRPRLADESITVKTTYDNPRRFRRSSIGIGKSFRSELGVEIGDFVQVESNGNKINLQVRGSPKELASRGSDCYTKNPVSISRAVREQLRIQQRGRRNTPQFKCKFNGVKIKKLRRS